MSKFNEVFERCTKQIQESTDSWNTELLEAIAKGLGPSIYKQDAILVSTGSKDEVDRIRTNFITKKFGIEGKRADDAIEYATNKIGSSNKNKLRPVFYYFIVESLGQESHYVSKKVA